VAIKKTGYYKGKSNRLGGGGQFLQRVDAIRNGNPKMSLKEARGIAAKEVRKEIGSAKLQKLATAGRRRQARKRGNSPRNTR